MKLLDPLRRAKHYVHYGAHRERTAIPWLAAVNHVAGSSVLPMSTRNQMLRLAGLDVDPSARLGFGLTIRGPHVRIGRDSSVNDNGVLDRGVTIGAGTQIAVNCTLLSYTHEIGTSERRAGVTHFNPCAVGNGCWLGANVTVLPGVKVEDGCVVAAGSVVTKSTAPDGLYAGVPARRIRDLPHHPA